MPDNLTKAWIWWYCSVTIVDHTFILCHVIFAIYSESVAFCDKKEFAALLDTLKYICCLVNFHKNFEIA